MSFCTPAIMMRTITAVAGPLWNGIAGHGKACDVLAIATPRHSSLWDEAVRGYPSVETIAEGC